MVYGIAFNNGLWKILYQKIMAYCIVESKKLKKILNAIKMPFFKTLKDGKKRAFRKKFCRKTIFSIFLKKVNLYYNRMEIK